MESMNRKDRLWMFSMKVCRRFSGCHQMPERSFFIGSYQLPLCARCTGIVIGHVLGIVVAMFCKVSFWTLLGTLPLMVDGTLQEATGYESTNPRRLLTGIFYGFGVMNACIQGIKRILRMRRG